MTFLQRPQMNPIDFAYFKPHTHTHTHTCAFTYVTLTVMKRESGFSGESELMLMLSLCLSVSLSLTDKCNTHSWMAAPSSLPHFTPLQAARAHFHAHPERNRERKRESARERGGWKLVKTRASLATALHHSFIPSSAHLLSESLVQENQKKLRAAATTTTNKA